MPQHTLAQASEATGHHFVSYEHAILHFLGIDPGHVEQYSLKIQPLGGVNRTLYHLTWDGTEAVEEDVFREADRKAQEALAQQAEAQVARNAEKAPDPLDDLQDAEPDTIQSN
jgi:hypothetical protein